MIEAARETFCPFQPGADGVAGQSSVQDRVVAVLANRALLGRIALLFGGAFIGGLAILFLWP